MYELKKIGKVFTSKFVRTGHSSYKKRIYRAAVSQILRNTGIVHYLTSNNGWLFAPFCLCNVSSMCPAIVSQYTGKTEINQQNAQIKSG